MRPLYKSVANIKLKKGTGNTGLWYDKFCDTWPDHAGKDFWNLQSRQEGKQIVNPKMDWMKTVTAKNVGERDLLTEACLRQARLAAACGMKVVKYSTIWRFVTGLGRQHPVENGFAWHQTLGVPYLPGSSIKGMVRAWAEQWEEIKDGNRIFGDKGEEVSAGSVIFLDALPSNRVFLEIDVMTPHYSPYYRDGKPPGDWYDPTPIPFLTVAANQVFQFAVLPRMAQDTQYQEDTKQVLYWLRLALENLGAGAKTAVGYGRFKGQDKKKADQKREEWETATLKHTPNDGKFTVINIDTKATATCPSTFQPAMKEKFGKLSKTRKKKAKSGGLPCTATVVIQGDQSTVRTVTVVWTGEETTTYGADES